MRNASVWAFSALFGCISLFGPGWHCFVGHPFHALPGCHDCCGVHDDFNAHDHAADCASAHPDQAATRPLRGPVATAPDDHNCPICQFFAQAQWVVAWGPAELECTLSAAAPHPEQAVWVVRVGSYRSRAPPGGSRIS